MTLEDPFFVVKDEVLKALVRTRGLFERYSADERDKWSATELQNSIRSIEWDLEDLEDTIKIVEKNPSKFRMDSTELSARKSFISQIRAEVRQMKSKTDIHNETIDMTEDVPKNVNAGTSSQYARLPTTSLDSPVNSTSQLFQQQRQLVQEQDLQIEDMSESVGHIRDISHQIGSELDEQAVMLDEFGSEIENAETKLDATMRKMAKMLHMNNDRRQWMAIGFLSSATIILLLMIFSL